MSRRNRVSAPAAPASAPVESTHDEVTEVVDTTVPALEIQPTKPAGTSNLACTIRQHRHRYVPALAPSGKKTANNGDQVATILLHTPLPALAAFVLEAFGKRYDHLNKGHERMCCGNLVRAAAQKGDQRVLEFLAAHAPKQEPQDDEQAA